MQHSLLLVLLLVGCPSVDPEPSEPTPAPSPDLSVRAGPGEARAGVVSVEQAGDVLFGGIAAEGQAGDVLLFNDRVRFVIQGSREGHGYVNSGGHVIDADLVRPEGAVGRDLLEDLFLAFGIGWLFHADRLDVVQNGLDGGSVLVRATGRAQQWTFIAGVSESPDPIVPDPGVAVVREYELAPDSSLLAIRTRMENDGDAAVRFNPSDGWMAAREDVQTWSTGEGLDPGAMEQGAAGEAGRNGEYAFGLWRPDGPLDALAISGALSGSGILIFGAGWQDLEPGQVMETERWFGVAQDVNTLERLRLEQRGEALGTIAGRVLDPAGQPVAGARVHFYDDASPTNVAGYAVSDAEGAWSASLPPGSWTAIGVATAPEEQVPLPSGAGRYGPFVHPGPQQRTLDALGGDAPAFAHAVGHGVLPGTSVSVVAGEESTVDVNVGHAGVARITLRDGDGAVLSGYAELRAAGGEDHSASIAANERAALGLPQDANTVLAWFAGEGTEIAVPPGTWDVHVEASYRHERQVIEGVVVPEGGVVDIEATLEQRIDFDGWMSVDSHLHAAPSGDGSLPMEDRLFACAASWIQIPVTTDHDASTDYRPLGTALGLDARSRSVPGLEVSPVLRGHFNMFPFEPDRAEVNNGAEPWWVYPQTTDELMARMRARRPDAIIQVNHGRDGMFSLSNYIDGAGQPGDPSRFSWNFDVFELAASEQEELQADFFSFLDHGTLRTPMGVSDSHGRTATCGKGRTDVFLGVDDPRDVTDAALTDAIRAGHVVVARGVTLRASVGDALPGDVVTGGSVDVTVQALPWMRPTEVRLWRNGVVVETRPVDDVADGATWFDGSFALESDSDAWFVVEAHGGAPMGGIWRGTGPWAMTNAFLFDADGDGWTAPALQ